MASAWQNPDNSSLLLTFTATKRATPIDSLATTLDLAEFGFGAAATVHARHYTIDEIVVGPEGPSDGDTWHRIGTSIGGKVELKMVLGVRGVALLRIQQQQAK
jgi:hypothetical protein